MGPRYLRALDPCSLLLDDVLGPPFLPRKGRGRGWGGTLWPFVCIKIPSLLIASYIAIQIHLGGCLSAGLFSIPIKFQLRKLLHLVKGINFQTPILVVVKLSMIFEELSMVKRRRRCWLSDLIVLYHGAEETLEKLFANYIYMHPYFLYQYYWYSKRNITDCMT